MFPRDKHGMLFPGQSLGQGGGKSLCSLVWSCLLYLRESRKLFFLSLHLAHACCYEEADMGLLPGHTEEAVDLVTG